MAVSEEAPQPWVAMGHFCHVNKKSPRAVYFAHKACLLDTRCGVYCGYYLCSCFYYS